MAISASPARSPVQPEQTLRVCVSCLGSGKSPAGAAEVSLGRKRKDWALGPTGRTTWACCGPQRCQHRTQGFRVFSECGALWDATEPQPGSATKLSVGKKTYYSTLGLSVVLPSTPFHLPACHGAPTGVPHSCWRVASPCLPGVLSDGWAGPQSWSR